jgi:DNA-binding transcriptional regulator YiaG
MRRMPNIASVLKEEIARIARKEVRRETASLKKAVATYRGEIADLKRRAQLLERALKKASRGAPRAEATAAAGDADGGTALRFRPKGFASLRAKLGISANEAGKLLGVSGQSIYLWESGRARPSRDRLVAIAALRKAGKRQVQQRLEALG